MMGTVPNEARHEAVSGPSERSSRAGMLLADVVATSAAVASTRSRNAKVESIAALLARCDDEEIVPVVGFLTGEPRQGRVGVGWATLAAVRDELAGHADGAT